MMRKLLLTGIISALFTLCNFGQNWFPVGAEWYFNEQLLFDFPAHGYTKYTVDKDTLINSMDAKKIIACTWEPY